MNQLINVAVAQMLAAHGASNYVALRARRANLQRGIEILDRAGRGRSPMESDELPNARKPNAAAKPAAAKRYSK